MTKPIKISWVAAFAKPRGTAGMLCMVMLGLFIAYSSCEKPDDSGGGNTSDTVYRLPGTQWRLVGIVEAQELKLLESNYDESDNFIIEFNEDSTLSGWGNCNELEGYYEIDSNNNIYWEWLGLTKVACNIPHFYEENSYMLFLWKTRFFSIKKHELKLYKDKQNYLLYKSLK